MAEKCVRACTIEKKVVPLHDFCCIKNRVPCEKRIIGYCELVCKAR